ncbi:MAG: hypothetical protein N3B68_03960 [Anaerolineae bacterium]|nr:hypothetical protein [Anaerolineae bacterium]
MGNGVCHPGGSGGGGAAEPPRRPLLCLLTGPSGAGKTTFCQEVVARARQKGYTCGGLLTLRGEGSARLGVDIGTGCARLLTRPEGGGIRQGSYIFDPEALAWGTAVIVSSVPCDLFVLDELGPLEIERGEGWAVGLEVLRRRLFRLGLAVVRPGLVGRMVREFPGAWVLYFPPGSADSLQSSRIAAALIALGLEK